ncbi:hypothetical protein CTI12_AA618250 [Artemisia annua]|uniref:Uncharacterized protein n=1 Tax=Artemisia annua TaxID=35608 RepID=A0A2U1KD26_ARTAN|nr:hypothetical protein CTI12_AA618250 [Artemisia annua]
MGDAIAKSNTRGYAYLYVHIFRVLNQSYTNVRVNSSSYYSRFFEPVQIDEEDKDGVQNNKRKRKRKVKKTVMLNLREQEADERHQRAKPFLVKAHECLMEASDLLLNLPKLRSDKLIASDSGQSSDGHSFVELGSVWQAPLFEIALAPHQDYRQTEGSVSVQNCEKRNIPAFGSLVANETNSDMEADFLNRRYIIPKQSSFYMHVMYPTLPNRYFLSLPIMRLAHADGALVALWVTNKEKLRIFVEKELFPKWGVKYMATHYWLKVKADGSLIGELDLFHHRPYECLVLGYCHGKNEDAECFSRLKSIPDAQVFISIPGDYSRKPPIGEMLRKYIPGSAPAHCLELFARELLAGWTSWGNEPLRFQDTRYFSKIDQQATSYE